MIKKVCETCGGDDVFIDAYAEWDTDTQSWELCATYDASWCTECDTGTNIIDKPADQMIKQTKSWLVEGKITCPDVAQMWNLNIGDAEFRLLDHPDNPGSSADFPSKKSAMDWAKAKGIAVVDMTEQTHITLTGPMAGQPACGISRGDMIEQGGRGMHLPYLSSKGLLIDFALQHITCDDCRAAVFQSIHRRA